PTRVTVRHDTDVGGRADRAGRELRRAFGRLHDPAVQRATPSGYTSGGDTELLRVDVGVPQRRDGLQVPRRLDAPIVVDLHRTGCPTRFVVVAERDRAE